MSGTQYTSPINDNSAFAFEPIILVGKLQRYGMPTARVGGNPRDGWCIYGTDPRTSKLVFFYTGGAAHRWCVAQRQAGRITF